MSGFLYSSFPLFLRLCGGSFLEVVYAVPAVDGKETGSADAPVREWIAVASTAFGRLVPCPRRQSLFLPYAGCVFLSASKSPA